MARFSWPWASRERFSNPMGLSSDAFAAWMRGDDASSTTEIVTPQTVLGLTAILRGTWVISTTIAGLPLRTYERHGDEKVRIESVFDDPFPGIDGMTRFAWVETMLIHLVLWRHAFLWHEARDPRDGTVTAYRPIIPDAFHEVKRVDGKRRFVYTDGDNQRQEVGSEALTYIPGPSLDGIVGHPLLYAARSVFSGALSGDKAAGLTLRRGIRLAGLLVPDEGEEVEQAEVDAMLEHLRANVVGRENAGDVAVFNRRMKLQPWTPTNIESQWNETRQYWLGEAERITGVPAHLMGDTEKQTSWGTGVAEQNLGLARYTLMGWSSRIEQVLSQRLPRGQFVEFDYAGLLQGTPEDEIKLLIEQMNAGLITRDEARRIRNLPPLPSGGELFTARDAAEVIQKIYLGVVNGVLSADEARQIVNRAGAGLTGPAPTPARPAPSPDPQGATA